MPQQIHRPAANSNQDPSANTTQEPLPPSVVRFPVDLCIRARLHHRCIRSDACAFWKEVRQGYAVAVEGAGALDAIWVKDEKARGEAAVKWHDKPILIAGELRVVADAI